MNNPVNKAMLEAESRALWRAVYAARLVNNRSHPSAASEADLAVAEYRQRYKTKDEHEAQAHLP